MQQRFHYVALVVAATALLAVALRAQATRPDLDTVWQDYTANQASLEPAYTFPHSTCFRVAALEYGLP